MKTKEYWINYLTGAPEEVKNETIIYFSNQRVLFNQNKLSLNKDLIEFQKAINELGISSKSFSDFSTLL